MQVAVGDPTITHISVEKLNIITPGDLGPDFVATSLEGMPVKLSDYRGKVVLIDFWATWCSPCVAEMPNIKKALNEYGASGDFVVIGVSLDGDEAIVRKFIDKKEIPWTQIVGGPVPGNPVAESYNVVGIPATYLLDRNGKVIATDIRGRQLEVELQKLLPRTTAQANLPP
jgi:peroxiredoxin